MRYGGNTNYNSKVGHVEEVRKLVVEHFHHCFELSAIFHGLFNFS